jgi:type II secretory pathway component PulK
MILRSNSHRRAGWTLIYVLVIVAVLTAFMAIAAQNVASGRKLLVHRANQLQAQWLARAGLELATERWQTNPAYQGEVIELIAESRLEIKIEKDGDGNGVVITSEAQCTGIGTMPVKTTIVAKRSVGK